MPAGRRRRNKRKNKGRTTECKTLLAFAEHVCDNGFEHTSAYAAAGELVRACLPRRATGIGETLRRADEDAGQESQTPKVSTPF